MAVFVLEIGLLGIAGFYAYGFKITKTARNQTIASNLASGLLDDKLAIPYDNLEIKTESSQYSNDPTNPFYSWNYEIKTVFIDDNLSEQTLETNMKKIIVTISWQEADSPKNFQTASIKARH